MIENINWSILTGGAAEFVGLLLMAIIENLYDAGLGETNCICSWVVDRYDEFSCRHDANVRSGYWTRAVTVCSLRPGLRRK